MRSILTCILLAAFLPLSAQSDAKTILDKSAAKIKAHKAVEIDFVLTMENEKENVKDSYDGKAYMKDNLYKLDVMDVVNYYDGKAIYTYMPEVEEVTIKDPSEEQEETLNPTQLFDLHNSNFSQKLISNQGNVAYIELYPKDEELNMQKIGLWVNTGNYSIQKVVSFGKDDNNITITIKAIRQPAEIPADSFFSFDASQFPGVEVIDLR